MTAIVELLGSWEAVWLFFGVAFLLGFAPGAALRLILLLYPRDHPRRQELIGELYAMGRIERPVFVFEQLELAIFEGIPLRRAQRRERQRGPAGRQWRERLQLASMSLASVLIAISAGLTVFMALRDPSPLVATLVNSVAIAVASLGVAASLVYVRRSRLPRRRAGHRTR